MEFSQAFPIAIIDADYEGKSAAGRGMHYEVQGVFRERVDGSIKFHTYVVRE